MNKSGAPPREIVAYSCSGRSYEGLLAFEEQNIADYLTYFESEIYKRVQSHELLSQSWSIPERACLARNVIDFIQRANALSFWVATAILLQPKVKKRTEVLVKFIEIAHELKEQHNYNGLMGIIAGLNTSSVSRLKFTFGGLKEKTQQTLDALQDLMNPTKAFQKLRESVAVAHAKSVVPYVGMHLSDLTFIDEGNKNTITADDGTVCINLGKQQMIQQNIKKLLYHQDNFVGPEVTLSGPIYTMIYELPRLEEMELYPLSLEREPRNATTVP